MKEKASWQTWTIVLILVGLMLAGAFYLRPDLLERAKIIVGWPEPEEVEVVKAAPESSKKEKKQKRKRPKKRSRANTERPTEAETDDTWEDIEFGNIFEEPDEVVTAEAEPEFVPPPEMWQPEGRYQPSARWTASGFDPTKPQEIDLNGPDRKPLSEADIKSVLNERRLMPCYREVAIKVPQMKGNVDFQGVISGDGQIAHIRVKRSELRSKDVESCMVSTIRNLRFPSTGTLTKFTMDFDFN